MREVVILKHCRGWTLEQIAEQLGKTGPAVASLLRRGLEEAARRNEIDGDAMTTPNDPTIPQTHSTASSRPTSQAVEAGQSPDRQELLDRHPRACRTRSARSSPTSTGWIGRPPRCAWRGHPTRRASAATRRRRRVADASATSAITSYSEEIARGGMGVVYKARQVSLNRIVALKMILAGQFASEGEVQRFYAEARAAANLQHPNIVAIHEVGEHEDQHYFSMDYIEGKSLRADRPRKPACRPKRPPAYLKTIAEAIEFAHRQGTLHRDLKPSNVLIDRFDQPQVTDFGLAKRIEGTAQLTATGTLAGTPSYMPPEQAGRPRRQARPSQRRLFAGRLAVRAGHRPPAVSGRDARGHANQVLNANRSRRGC